MRLLGGLALAMLLVWPVACDSASEGAAAETGDELPIGAIDDLKLDGDWRHATTCKEIPEVTPLADPYIVISLDGLTLHLVDRAGDYDRVFPIGPGAAEDGVSLTPVSTGASQGVFYTRTDLRPTQDGPTPDQRRWGWNESCRIWWTSESGQKVPVFAGLPFIRLEGPPVAGYGIHGPIDSYTRVDGGTLRRGYVSHGCVRMAAVDIVEVYARIQGHRAPVRIQKAVERDADDRAVDVPDPWLLAECRDDADCPYEGGVCRANPYSGRGFCTKDCDLYCPDRQGYPVSFCVDDPADPAAGICTLRSTPESNACRRFDHFVAGPDTPRHGQPGITRDACLPGTEGWVGDRCLADTDCVLTQDCRKTGDGAGFCTEPCSRYCPDLDGGYAVTFCVDNPLTSSATDGMCVARCASNDECPLGATCELEPRANEAAVTRTVCLPY